VAGWPCSQWQACAPTSLVYPCLPLVVIVCTRNRSWSLLSFADQQHATLFHLLHCTPVRALSSIARQCVSSPQLHTSACPLLNCTPIGALSLTAHQCMPSPQLHTSACPLLDYTPRWCDTLLAVCTRVTPLRKLIRVHFHTCMHTRAQTNTTTWLVMQGLLSAPRGS